MPCYMWYHKVALHGVSAKDAISAALETYIHNISAVTRSPERSFADPKGNTVPTLTVLGN